MGRLRLPLTPRKPSKPDVPGELPRPPSVDSNRQATLPQSNVLLNKYHNYQILPFLERRLHISYPSAVQTLNTRNSNAGTNVPSSENQALFYILNETSRLKIY
ncbi:hypothetical protein TNCT_226911 [Trichonephila clavata]|uniref:Uncharacterized protein n=1 Tax=Trichonephila clavata TaxID=2740835 RepID=A0A8X6KHN4_TRICU|nr:hypothetical protein TNCT_226911 [Trichonephila clavata]